MTAIEDPVYFGGIDLNSIDGWMTTRTSYRYPNRNVTNYSLANQDDSVTTSAYFSSKIINLEGIIAVAEKELLETAISSLRNILDPINQVLQLPIAGEQRKYKKTTVSSIAITDSNGGYCEVDIEFVSSNYYSYSITTTEALGVVNLTSGNKSYPVTFYGIGDQVPVITYTIDSLTSGQNKTVTFSNPGGDTISIQRTWSAGEVLIIDCDNKTVQISGEDIEFNGNFPKWQNGERFINYTDDFTARQVDINVTYYKRFK